MKTDMQAIYPLVFIVLLVAFTQGCTGGQHQVSSPIGPVTGTPGVQEAVAITPGPSGTPYAESPKKTSAGPANMSVTVMVPGSEGAGQVYTGDILHVEGETILSPGNRLQVTVEQPEFGPTSKHDPRSPTGGSRTVVVIAPENGSMNRYEADFPTGDWNCGEYTIIVTGIDVPVMDEHPFTLVCRQ